MARLFCEQYSLVRGHTRKHTHIPILNKDSMETMNASHEFHLVCAVISSYYQSRGKTAEFMKVNNSLDINKSILIY